MSNTRPSKELVTQLRAGSNDPGDCALLYRAANEIERLQQQCDAEALISASRRDEIDRLRGELDACEQHVKILQEQRASLEPGARQCGECGCDLYSQWEHSICGDCIKAFVDEAICNGEQSRRAAQPPSDNVRVVTEYQRGFDDEFKRAADGLAQPPGEWRALLMQAYDELPDTSLLREKIMDAVAPVGQVDEHDIEWARTALTKLPGDSNG